ncbi:MAG: hypothetical protein JWM98_3385 [Thermoleophilia bacterium]|nr:hypothetical protein [Thermoleophilia bacterium]
MSSTHTDIAIVLLLLGGMAFFGLAMLGVVLRIGPRRGAFNQPAAALRRPGRGMFVSMYALAALHVVLGLVAAIAVPGGGIGVLLVLVGMAVFYVLCAHSFALAATLTRRRGPAAPPHSHSH